MFIIYSFLFLIFSRTRSSHALSQRTKELDWHLIGIIWVNVNDHKKNKSELGLWNVPLSHKHLDISISRRAFKLALHVKIKIKANYWTHLLENLYQVKKPSQLQGIRFPSPTYWLHTTWFTFSLWGVSQMLKFNTLKAARNPRGKVKAKSKKIWFA